MRVAANKNIQVNQPFSVVRAVWHAVLLTLPLDLLLYHSIPFDELYLLDTRSLELGVMLCAASSFLLSPKGLLLKRVFQMNDHLQKSNLRVSELQLGLGIGAFFSVLVVSYALLTNDFSALAILAVALILTAGSAKIYHALRTQITTLGRIGQDRALRRQLRVQQLMSFSILSLLCARMVPVLVLIGASQSMIGLWAAASAYLVTLILLVHLEPTERDFVPVCQDSDTGALSSRSRTA